ncbi:hypothetical protein B5S32_g5372 [[Candida] boidinii]|nr:hypothetical protein B5S32_g5372 [[Candida] boidinii]
MAPPPITDKPLFPQALSTNFINRIKNDQNSLFVTTLPVRGSKRSTSHTVNYAEVDQDYEFEEDDDSFNGYNTELFVNTNTNTNTNNTITDSSNNGSINNNNNGNSNNDTINGRNSNLNNNDSINATINLTNYQGKEAPKFKPQTIFTELELNYNNSLPELMIPVRLNLEYQSAKISDIFMWNINETLITPNIFANLMCQELELPNSYQNQIINSISSAIEEYQQLINTPFPINELHTILNLSVSLDNQLYEDKFEWDLVNTLISPEEFADCIVSDMSLPREFKSSIAASLHELILKYKLEFLSNEQLLLYNNQNLPNSNEVYQSNINIEGIYSNHQGLRYDLKTLGKSWIPNVEILTQWEIEKREIERERNIRRLKRESMRVNDDYNNGTSKRRSTRRRYDELEGTWKTV